MKSVKVIVILVIVQFCLTGFAVAATFYVNGATGNDLNSGLTPTLAWKNISKADATLRAGDTVIVAAGVYEAVISPANSGAQGSPITYLAQSPDTVTVRQFFISGKNYIRVIGFTITHNNDTYIKKINRAIILSNSNHCEILHNRIHHTEGGAIYNNLSSPSSYNTIRGNTISYIGCPSGAPGRCVCASAVYLFGDYNIVEHNDVSIAGDFFDLYGNYNIIRNNYAHLYANSYFPDATPNALHNDFWQPFSFDNENLTNHNIVENNFAEEIAESNSHFFQVRNQYLLEMSHFIIRGNVGNRFGSYVAQLGGVKDVKMYNNTFIDFDYLASPKSWSTINLAIEKGSLGTGNVPAIENSSFNNIFYNVNRDTGSIFSVPSGCSITTDHNACQGSGTHPSCVNSSNVAFANFEQGDFHLSSVSGAKNVGRAVTNVSSNTGSGTSFTVVDAKVFHDGFGITEGDLISIAGAPAVRILNIDYANNSIVVDKVSSWKQADGVVLQTQASTPSIGAYEYSSNFSYAVNIAAPTFSSDGALLLLANVDGAENVRAIEFLVDGNSVGLVKTPPFSLSVANIDRKTPHQLSAIAYARFADRQVWRRSDFALASSVDSTPPSAPLGLSIFTK